MTEIKKMPKVSVCVITFNQEKYIRQCLESIVNQITDFEFEIIVGEDCSLDGTRAVVMEFSKKYPRLFRLILHNSNVGGCENYRQVHFAARGEFIAHLDGDDYWYQDKLQSQINFMECYQNCAAVYTNARVKLDSGEIIGIFSSGVKNIFDLTYLIKTGNFLTNSSTMYRAKFREDVIPTSGEFVDFLIHIHLAQCGELGFIDRNLVLYTHRSATSVSLRDNIKVRLLLWDAFKAVKLPKAEIHIIEKAKLIFIAETVIYEWLYGSRQSISKWVSLLTAGSMQNVHFLHLNLIYFVAIILTTKALNRFRRSVRKRNQNHVFFKKNA